MYGLLSADGNDEMSVYAVNKCLIDVCVYSYLGGLLLPCAKFSRCWGRKLAMNLKY